MTIEVGTELWARTDYGRPDWVSERITGETKQSWLVGKWATKINKKTMLENLGQRGSRRWFTERGMEEDKFVTANRWKISKIVETLGYEQLCKVAELVGYEPSSITPNNITTTT